MKLAIIGSRTFNDYEFLHKVIDEFWYDGKIELIISGGAKGADSLAEKYANEHFVPLKVFPAEWDKYGKSAGYRRNVDIVKEADWVVAFWDGKSKGTKHSIDLANKYGKKLIVQRYV
jgi:hypothetical protein